MLSTIFDVTFSDSLQYNPDISAEYFHLFARFDKVKSQVQYSVVFKKVVKIHVKIWTENSNLSLLLHNNESQF